eukprot:6225430-Lingulodinium_polyedra.AAC.1
MHFPGGVYLDRLRGVAREDCARDGWLRVRLRVTQRDSCCAYVAQNGWRVPWPPSRGARPC